MTTDINMKQLKADALEIFCNGFACSESVIFSLRKHFQVDISDDAIAMSSGWTMMIGYFFGRKTPGDPKVKRCFDLTAEFHDAFKNEFGATCCRILTKGMEKHSQERKNHCMEMVSFTVEKVADIIIRELEKDKADS